MPVLSDKTIHTLCTRPTHLIVTGDWNTEWAWEGVTHTDREFSDKRTMTMEQYLDMQLHSGHPEALKIIDEWENWKPMIEPFTPESVKVGENGSKIASYGTSSYGYDIRAAPEWKLFSQTYDPTCLYFDPPLLDYKNITEDQFHHVEADEIIIPPNGFVLTRSVEYVRIPKDVLVLCIGKSTIARAGINCLCTPLEPGWEGHITLEFSNSTNLPNKLYANEGILQLIFLRGDQPCRTTYADRGGKYNRQGSEIILPRV